MTNLFGVSALRSVLLIAAFHGIVSAATITGVTFTGNAANPTVNITGTGFGSAPASTAVGTPGYTGLDYGTIFYFVDPTSFSAGFENPPLAEHDLIGFANLSYTNTAISFTFGNEYTTLYYPAGTYHLNAGDSFYVVVAGVTYNGTVAYPAASTVPEPTSAACLGLGALGLLTMTLRKARRG